jgi:hypothetical protein
LASGGQPVARRPLTWTFGTEGTKFTAMPTEMGKTCRSTVGALRAILVRILLACMIVGGYAPAHALTGGAALSTGTGLAHHGAAVTSPHGQHAYGQHAHGQHAHGPQHHDINRGSTEHADAERPGHSGAASDTAGEACCGVGLGHCGSASSVAPFGLAAPVPIGLGRFVDSAILSNGRTPELEPRPPREFAA